MMDILEKEEDKADWQDHDPDNRVIKSWVKEGKQPTGMEMNFKTPEVQAYRKVLFTLKLKQVEGKKDYNSQAKVIGEHNG